MGSAVMQIIFASALYDANHKKVWSNPDLVDDEVDELVVLTNEKWLLLLNGIATLKSENAKQRALLVQSREAMAWILGGEPLDTLMLAAVRAIDAALQPQLSANKVDVVSTPVRTHEQEYALAEGHCIGASDKYFAARPAIDFSQMRKIFNHAYMRAWAEANLLAAQEGK